MERTDEQKGFSRDLRALFDTPLGEKILAKLELGTIHAPIYPPGARNPEGPKDEALYAAFREGQNNLIRQIKREIALGREGR